MPLSDEQLRQIAESKRRDVLGLLTPDELERLQIIVQPSKQFPLMSPRQGEPEPPPNLLEEFIALSEPSRIESRERAAENRRRTQARTAEAGRKAVDLLTEISKLAPRALSGRLLPEIMEDFGFDVRARGTPDRESRPSMRAPSDEEIFANATIFEQMTDPEVRAAHQRIAEKRKQEARDLQNKLLKGTSFVANAIVPGTRENAITSRFIEHMAKAVGQSFLDLAEDPAKQLREHPGEFVFNTADIFAATAIARRLGRTALKGTMDDVLEAAVKQADETPEVAAGMSEAAAKTADDLQEAAIAARAEGAHEAADDLLVRRKRIEQRREELAEIAGKDVQAEVDQMREAAVKPVSKPAADTVAAKLPPDAGEIKRDLAIRLGGSALGGFIGNTIATREGDQTFSPYGTIVGGVLGLVGGRAAEAFVGEPRFRRAVANWMSIRTKQRKVPLEEVGNLEEVISAFIEPILPDTYITSERVSRLAAGLGPPATAGFGALIGGVREEGIDPAGAALGAVTGLAIGGRAFRNVGELFPGGFNPRLTWQRIFTESRGLTPEAQRLRRRLLDMQSGRIAEIMDTAAVLARADQPTANLIDNYLRGNISKDALPEAFRDAAATTRDLFDELGLDLIEVGLAEGKAAEAIRTNLGTYLPRLYLFWERQDALLRAERWLRARGEPLSRLSNRDYLKGRKDVSREVREAWEEISAEFGKANPAYLLARRGVVTASDIEFARYSKFLGSSPEHTLPQSVARPVEKGEELLPGMEARAISGPRGRKLIEWQGERYMKLPDNRRLGVLKNRYVREAEAMDLETFIEVPSALSAMLQRGTALFKASKVTFNPATLMRNVYGNIILADQGGFSPARLDDYIKSIKADYLGQTARYKEARSGGLFRGEFFGTEIEGQIRSIDRARAAGHTTISGGLMNWVGRAADAPLSRMARFHEGSEQAWKMVMFNYARDHLGMDVAEAVRYAKRYIFDYREVPRWLNVTRRSPFGIPFISFSYKALPRVIENAVAVGDPKKAFRFWKYPLAMGAVNESSARELGIVKEEEKGFWNTTRRIAASGLGFSMGEFGKVKNMMPDYTGDQQVLLRYTDRFGRWQFFDATWTLPWGDLGEMGKGKLGQVFAKMGVPFPRQLEPSNPFLQTVVAGLTGGKDPFTGKDIVPIYEDPGMALIQSFRYLGRQFLPTLFTPGGFSFEKLRKSFGGGFATRPDIPTPGMAVLSEVFGIKIRPLDPTQALGFKFRDLEKKQRQFMGDLFRMMSGLPADVRFSVQEYAAGHGKLSAVPKVHRGTAKTLRRRVDNLRRDVKETQKKLPKPEEVPPQSEELLRALRGER